MNHSRNFVIAFIVAAAMLIQPGRGYAQAIIGSTPPVATCALTPVINSKGEPEVGKHKGRFTVSYSYTPGTITYSVPFSITVSGVVFTGSVPFTVPNAACQKAYIVCTDKKGHTCSQLVDNGQQVILMNVGACKFVFTQHCTFKAMGNPDLVVYTTPLVGPTQVCVVHPPYAAKDNYHDKDDDDAAGVDD
jgi:hypothetical protein